MKNWPIPTPEFSAQAIRHQNAMMAIPAGVRSGTVACPACAKLMHFDYGNGEASVRIHCETPGCVAIPRGSRLPL